MGYSKSRIFVRRIPVAVEVKPIRIGVEPDNYCSQLINSKSNALH